MLRRLFALVVLAALAAAGYYYWRVAPRGADDLGPFGRRVQDLGTAGAVRTAFALNRRLAGADIAVSAEDGVVTLRGSVADETLRALAADVAGAVPDVRQVVSHLAVAAPAPAVAGDDRTLGERLDDQALEAKLRLAFALDRELQDERIAVRVRRRQVALSGQVTRPARRDRARRVAQDLPDVSGVTDDLQVAGTKPGID
jgi:osmotically-inducible protein OsmY